MELKKSLYSAFIKFQQEFKGLKPDGNNPFFKSSYITLDGILETVRPILAKNDLAVMQEATGDGEHVFVKTILVHSSGESLETELLKMKPQKSDAQQMGSCITYAKRYQLGALLGICESVDDDGNKATFGENNPINNKKQELSPLATPTAEEQLQAQTEVKKIDKVKLEALQNLIDTKGANTISLCKRYKIKSLPEMTIKMYLDAKTLLEAAPDKTPINLDLGL